MNGHKSGERQPGYTGEIVAGSLLIPESRIIAGLLLAGIEGEEWNQAIVRNNVLQKRSLATARRQARLIRNRLALMTPGHWELVRDGHAELTTQALMASAVKHSRLLADFMDKVIRECHRIYVRQLHKKDWSKYFDLCTNIEPALNGWAEPTREKVGEVVFRILAEGKYIDNTRHKNMLPVLIYPEIRHYLVENQDHFVLRCMEISQP